MPLSPPPVQLVFSDEFNQEGRNLSSQARDKRWTAHKMWYDATADYEVYRPEQARGPADVEHLAQRAIDRAGWVGPAARRRWLPCLLAWF